MKDTPNQRAPWWGIPERNPWGTLLIAAMLLTLALTGVLRLRTTGSLSEMFPRRHASARAMQAVAERFAGADSLLVVATCASEDARHSLLRFAERFEEALSADPRAGALITSARHRAPPGFRTFAETVVAPSLIDYLDAEDIAELRSRLTPEGMAMRLARAEAMLAAAGPGGQLGKSLVRDPLGLYELVAARITPGGFSGSDALFSTDGRSLLIEIAARHAVSDVEAAVALMRLVRQAATRAATDGFAVAYTGAYAIAEVAQREIRADMIASITGSVLLMQALFLCTYRRLASFPLAIFPVAMGVFFGFATAGWFFPILSPPVAVAGAVLAGLGIDYSVHVLSHFHAEGGGATRVIRRIAPPLIAGSVTSIIAFAAIALSDIHALRSFALIGVAGLAASLVASLTVLPAVLTLLHHTGATRPLSRWSPAATIAWIGRHARVLAVITGIAGLAAAGIAGAAWDLDTALEHDLNAMHPVPNAPIELQGRIAEMFLAAPEPLWVHLAAPDNAALVVKAHEVQRRLTGAALEPHVAGTFGLASLLPDPASHESRRGAAGEIDVETVVRDFHRAVEESAFSPEAMEPYAAYLRSALRPGDPPTLDTLRNHTDLTRRVLPRSTGPTPEALTVVFLRQPIDDRDTRDATLTAIRGAIHGVPGATLTGIPVVAFDAEHTILADLTRLLGLAGVLVILWLVIQFRSIIDALLALGPVALGLCVVAACVAMGVAHLNMVNIIAVPLIVGLGVDYGIFLVAAYRAAQRGAACDLSTAFAAPCHAVMVCALTTILGFGSLVFTSTPAIRSLGMLLGIGVGACLIGAVAWLVPVLFWRGRSR